MDVKVFEKLPALFGLSVEDNLKPKVEYITRDLGLDVKVFEKLPALFGYSLNNRIKPRTEFLRTKGKRINLLSHITRSDFIFCEKIVNCSLGEYQEFKDNYLNNM